MVRVSLLLSVLLWVPCVDATSSLSFSAVKNVLSTEATNEEPVDKLVLFDVVPPVTSADFDASVSAQWSKNKKRDEDAPYVLCDHSPGSGEDRRRRSAAVCDLPGSGGVVYNGDAASCFVHSLGFDVAKSCLKQADVTVTPVTPRMKMPAHTISGSLRSVQRRYLASLCAAHSDVATIERWTAIIVKKLTKTWNSEGECPSEVALASRYVVETAPDGVFLAPIGDDETPLQRGCVVSLLESLAGHAFVCGVEHAPGVKTMNRNARWIVQGAVQNGKNGYVHPLYAAGIRGEGQVAQVSDTGVSVSSCYFYDKKGEVPRDTTKTVQSSRRKVVQYYAARDDFDSDGHGTHCAGTIVGSLCQGFGCKSTTNAEGVAPAAQVAVYDISSMFDKFLYPEESTQMFPTGIAAGAYVHSASWGALSGNHYKTRDRDWDGFMWENQDYLAVVAAGNGGEDDTVGSVVNVGKNSLVVGASNNVATGKGENYLADFSGRGPTEDGRIKPDICAPGTNVESARNSKLRTCANRKLSGTSMATPGVAGAALLVRQYFMDGFYPSGEKTARDKFTPSQALIRAVILNSGQTLLGVDNSRNTKSVPYDMHQGFGRLSLVDSLKLQGRSTANIYVEDRVLMTNDSEPKEYTFDTGTCDVDYFSATLVWTDVPNGSTSCATCLVNRLQLTVENAGTITHPNGLTEPDVKNNVQRVRLPSAPGQTLRVKVSVANLAETTQPFALVVSGCFDVRTASPTDQPTDSPTFEFRPSSRPSHSRPPSTAPTHAPVAPSMQPSSVRTSGTLTIPLTSADGNWKMGKGNMFDILPKKTITLVDMDVHKYLASTKTLEIWSRRGSWRDAPHDRSKWTLLGQPVISGGGIKTYTSINNPDWLNLRLEAGQVYGLYIRYADDSSGLLTPQTRGKLGSVYAENQDVRVMTGSMPLTAFGDPMENTGFDWQGRLKYTICMDCASASPSEAPAESPDPGPPPKNCKEKKSAKFYYKTKKNGKITTKDCKWLRKLKEEASREKVCKKTQWKAGFSPARVVCRKTCKMC